MDDWKPGRAQPGRTLLAKLAIIGTFAGLVALGGAAPQAHASVTATDQATFDYFARHLLAGIGAANFSDIPARAGYGRPRIAVLPFPLNPTKVPPPVAAEFNSRLLAALTRQGSGAYRFVARQALMSIAKHDRAIAGTAPGTGGWIKDLMENAAVDILIVGRLRPDKPGFVLSYEALSVEDATLFAATGPRHVGGPAGFAAKPFITTGNPRASTPLPGPDPRPRAKVRDAQRLLAGLGYDPGPSDGVARRKTRVALRAFQRHHAMADHGRLTRLVMDRLRRSWRRAEIAL